jgi:CRISPR/Cas system-associated protein Cas10 (large subunit of type III CRISPR-Cas system)
LISLSRISKIYNNNVKKILCWLGVKQQKHYIVNPIEEIILVSKTEKDILTDIVIEHHEEEFRILETGDDGGSHFALYVPIGSETDIIAKLAAEKIKKRLIIITTPTGYIGTILR